MAKPTQRAIAKALLERHGRTYAQEVGIDVSKNTPSPLFRLLCMSLLFSARISADIAVAAAKALSDEGWTTAEKMANSTWSKRAKVLNESGYARYDERTSSMLGDTAQMVLEQYDGDLRKLREKAEREPDEERALLKEFKGIGDAGADIFHREVQLAWDEVFPFVDDRAQKGARALDLPGDAKRLAQLVDKPDFTKLVASLVRVQLEATTDEVLEAARG